MEKIDHSGKIKRLEKKIMTIKNVPDAWVHISALQHIGTPEARDALVRVLEHDNPVIFFWSAGALHELGDKRPVKALIKTLEDKHQGRVYQAAELLGKIGDKSALPALMKLSGHDHMSVNVIVRAAIWRIQHPEED